MLVVSMLSLKGGVGKTTVTLGLAGAAATRQLKALVVDLDPQANASVVLDPRRAGFTASDVLADARPGVLADAISGTSWGEYVDVVASEAALEHRNSPSDGRGGEHRLRSAMTGLTGYELVLVDCPPSLGELTKNALAASHLALVVAEPTLFSLQGAQQALQAVEVVRGGFNLRLRPAGIVVNRFRTQSAEHRFRRDELVAAYGDLVLDPALPDRSALTQAQGAFLPVQRWPSPGAREASGVLSRYLDHLLRLGAAEPEALTKGGRRERGPDSAAGR